MIAQVQKQIEQHKLFSNKSKVLIGLSGGPDSMVLIHILKRLDYCCIAAHCNFKLRGDHSDRDEYFVKKWCKENNVPLFSVSFDTNNYAAEKNISIEMAARELRYKWFEKISTEQAADVIAIAHHKDDSVETVLINLIRGTGIKGLTGIPVINKKIVRPLLTSSRSEVMDYLSVNKVPYVIDHTNEEEIYTRNILRLKVLPILESINPSVKNAIIKTSNNLKEVEKIYDTYIQSVRKEVLKNNLIDIAKLKQTHSQQSVLYEILSPLGFTPSVIEDISNNLDSISGKIYFAENYRLLKDREYLVLSKNNEQNCYKEEYKIHLTDKKIEYPLKLLFETNDYTTDFEIKKSKTILHVDIDKLSFPLTLRKWKKGDWFIPFGMKGKKKLSDYFIDNKFTLFDKEKTWVLLSGDDIIWVVNHRGDDRFKIDKATKRILTIQLIK